MLVLVRRALSTGALPASTRAAEAAVREAVRQKDMAGAVRLLAAHRWPSASRAPLTVLTAAAAACDEAAARQVLDLPLGHALPAWGFKAVLKAALRCEPRRAAAPSPLLAAVTPRARRLLGSTPLVLHAQLCAAETAAERLSVWEEELPRLARRGVAPADRSTAEAARAVFDARGEAVVDWLRQCDAQQLPGCELARQTLIAELDVQHPVAALLRDMGPLRVGETYEAHASLLEAAVQRGEEDAADAVVEAAPDSHGRLLPRYAQLLMERGDVFKAASVIQRMAKQNIRVTSALHNDFLRRALAAGELELTSRYFEHWLASGDAAFRPSRFVYESLFFHHHRAGSYARAHAIVRDMVAQDLPLLPDILRFSLRSMHSTGDGDFARVLLAGIAQNLDRLARGAKPINARTGPVKLTDYEYYLALLLADVASLACHDKRGDHSALRQLAREALDVLGRTPDGAFLATATSRRHMPDRALMFVIDLLDEHMELGVRELNALLATCADFERFDSLSAVVRLMGQRGLEPDAKTFQFMVKGSAKQGHIQEAEATLEEMARFGIAPDMECYVQIFRGYLSVHDTASFFRVYHRMSAAGVMPSEVVYSQLIAAHLLAGNMTQMEDLIDHVTGERGMTVALWVLHQILDVYEAQSRAEEVVELLRRHAGLVPSGRFIDRLCAVLTEQGKVDIAQAFLNLAADRKYHVRSSTIDSIALASREGGIDRE